MTAILNAYNNSIEQEIELNLAYVGPISALEAEKKLLNRSITKPYLYLLRAGECAGNFYVSYVKGGTIKHQPFTIHVTEDGWHFENGGTCGPFTNMSIEDVLHLIMHCRKDECVPLMV